MEQRPNAKLTPKGRETFVSRIESSLLWRCRANTTPQERRGFVRLKNNAL